MKKTILMLFSSFVGMMNAQNTPLPEKYQRLPFGEIKPTGWLKAQMQRDMQGFVGNLDKLVPELIGDPIYAERLHKHSAAKNLGNLKEGDAEGDEQYKWWNSETQSNWWDGYLRNAILLNDKEAIAKAENYVKKILATQDTDGYLGIYDRDLRYTFTGENGELWAKATLYRGLLAYYEYSHDAAVWAALQKAVEDVMTHYPIHASQPFFAGKEFSGGVAHGLTFTDVLDNMYRLTGDKKYWDYALFLYMNFSENYSSEKDIQLNHILDKSYKLQSHGVHTFEHLRPLIVAAYAAGNTQLQAALATYLARIEGVTTVAGGAIGDEWIAERLADASHTGYEYCSLHELLDSYTVLLQKSGNPQAAEQIENIFYNAAQGSRHPEHSCIAYLKTDNSFIMDGTKNGEIEPNRKQTRYKYSPAHQDVAVCCNPNAGRISPYFLQSAWLKEGENTLVAALLCPNTLTTTLQSRAVRIETVTEYPYKNSFLFNISLDKKADFTLKIRKPQWATSIQTKEKYQIEGDFIVIRRAFQREDKVELSFSAEVVMVKDANRDTYFRYGALVFARPIAATEQAGKVYAPGFQDWNYTPTETALYELSATPEAHYQQGKIYVMLKNTQSQATEKMILLPLGKTVLRQAAFK